MWTNDDHSGEEAEPSLQEAIQAELTEGRGIVMRFLRRLDAKAETEAGEEELVQLNAAAVKGMRALRQVAVLQLEIAGERPMPNSRGAAAPANQNGHPGGGAGGARARGEDLRTRGDYDTYEGIMENQFGDLEDRVKRVGAAMAADFRAAGREDLLRESPATQAEKLIYGIPHPVLDECLAGMEPKYAYLLFGEANVLPPKLGPGPPNSLAEWDARTRALRRDSG